MKSYKKLNSKRRRVENKKILMEELRYINCYWDDINKFRKNYLDEWHGLPDGLLVWDERFLAQF